MSSLLFLFFTVTNTLRKNKILVNGIKFFVRGKNISKKQSRQRLIQPYRYMPVLYGV